MLFVLVAFGIAALELWAVATGGAGPAAMPPALRLGGPILLTLSALWRKGTDRIAVAVTGGILFLFLNSDVMFNTTVRSILIGIGCAALGVIGVWSRRSSVFSVRVGAIAAVASLAAYLAFVWAFTR
jgi:hypothetical protein